MATITTTTTLPDSANKSDFYSLIDNATVTSIINADIAASASIVDTKLATITTAGKVNVSALVVADQADGDLIIYNSGWTRLAIGTTGQTLTVAAGLPAWA